MSFDPESCWPALKALAEAGNPTEMIDSIQSVSTPADRISLYRLTIRKLAFEPWKNRNLDVIVDVADAAIEDCEALGADYLEQANILCFNMSANLADCWADGFDRKPQHFRKGIEYARKALWYRDHLGKGPGSRAMATWALAKHQLSLGNPESRATFEQALRLETEAAREAGMPTTLSSEAPAGYMIARGYLAVLDRDHQAQEELAQALRSMHDAGGEAREEAQIIALQLSETAKHLGVVTDVFAEFVGARG